MGINKKRSRDSITGRTGKKREQRESKSSKSDKGPGRPKTLQEAKKTTMVFEQHQLDFLDQLSARITLETGAKLSRGAIVRALVDGLERVEIDLSNVEDGEDLARLLGE